MPRAFVAGPRPRDIEDHLGELPPTLFDDHVYACCELADRYATELALDLVHRLGLEEDLSRGTDVRTLTAERGFDSGFGPALGTLLDRLVTSRVLVRESGPGDNQRYRSPTQLRRPALRELREAGIALDPANTATLDLFDAAAAVYPAVAAGHTSGEKELFGAGHIGLWLAYFSNHNPAYVLNNTITASVAANRLPDRPGLRVLEVGAGAGSATRALLEEMERRGRLEQIELYDSTEPSPFFRRRGERELRARFPELPLRSKALDIDRDFAEQGAEGDYDLVVGVNVLHVAHDLGSSLARIREALAPGGWLVAGECLRLFPHQPVPADLIFQIFEGFVGVATDPDIRPRHGFLDCETWRKALTAAGLLDAQVVPDLERIRDHYPRFFAGVVAGRSSPVESTS